MSDRNFFSELKRRNVYKVAVTYAVVGWLLIQVATQVSGNLAALAEIQARADAPKAAVENLKQLLSIPAGETVSIVRLKIDPVWNPIRNDPGFQQLLTTREHVGP